MKTFAKTISIFLILLLAFSCSKEETLLPAGDELSDALKGAKVLDGTYELTGSTHFPAYAVKEHMVISPWDMNMLCCVATLEIDGHDLTLHTGEYMGALLIREVIFTGQISSGGIVKFPWPDAWWQIDGDKTIEDLGDQFTEHTGCIIYGPGNDHQIFGLEYQGKFDGDNFYAKAAFMGKQVDYGTVEFYTYPYLNSIGISEYEGDYIDGPIQFEFSIELCDGCECPPTTD